MIPRIQHLIETRFSVWMEPGPPRLAIAWLRERLDLLRRFCLPTVATQTTDAFTWLVLCDASTDRQIMAELRAHQRDLPMLEIAVTSAERGLQAAVRSHVDQSADILITTRLDSDDAIAEGYVEAIQAYATSFHRSTHRDLLVNFPRGYRFEMRSGTLYERRLPNSPFHSLFERPRLGPVRTVFHPLNDRGDALGDDGPAPIHEYHINHMLLHEHHITHQDESMPGWLQLLHDRNIHNRISPLDRELPRDAEMPGFARLCDGPLRRRGGLRRS